MYIHVYTHVAPSMDIGFGMWSAMWLLLNLHVLNALMVPRTHLILEWN